MTRSPEGRLKVDVDARAGRRVIIRNGLIIAFEVSRIGIMVICMLD